MDTEEMLSGLRGLNSSVATRRLGGSKLKEKVIGMRSYARRERN